MIRFAALAKWWWVWTAAILVLVAAAVWAAWPKPACARAVSVRSSPPVSRPSVTPRAPVAPPTYTPRAPSVPPTTKPPGATPPKYTSPPPPRPIPAAPPLRVVVVHTQTPVYIERHYHSGPSFWDYYWWYLLVHPQPVYYPTTPGSGAPAEHPTYVRKGCE